jgi:predicted RNase H-like HicB family nuclease
VTEGEQHTVIVRNAIETSSTSTARRRSRIAAMNLEEHLAVPYVLTMESVCRPDGEWVRRAAYPELPNCVAEAESPIDAIEQLDELRRNRIVEMLRKGEHIPVPRPPLASQLNALDADRLGFAKWLVQEGRIGT